MKNLFYLLVLIMVAFLVSCKGTPSEGAIQTAIAETETAQSGSEGAATATSEPATNTPTILPTETLTPTPSAVDWVLNEVEVVSFYLFEAGENPSNAANRNYANTFTQSDARVVYGDLKLEHPSPEEDMEFVLASVYFGPDGDIYAEESIEPLIERGLTMSNWIVGFGWDDPGHWDAGSYRVDLLVGEIVIASDSFDVIQFTPTPESTITPTYTPLPTQTNTPDPAVVAPPVSDRIVRVPGDKTDGDHPVNIKNKTGGNVTILMDGDLFKYQFNVPLGNHKIFLRPGYYFYTVYSCGGQFSGSHQFNANWTWTLSCN